MEGATGIVHRDQLLPGGYDYERGRRLLTRDVCAAVSAALSLEDVVGVRVCDGHGTMRNVLIEELPALCELVSGPASSKALCQSEGLDDTFGAAIFVGYHARAGASEAVLPHTWVGSLVHEIRVNGRVFGETALNAAIAGAFGVPVVFVSGDQAVCDEARADLGNDIVTFAVKRATGPSAALCLTPAATEDGIRLGVMRALADGARRKPFRVDGPVEFAVAFHRRMHADRAATRDGVERIGEREVALRTDTYLEAVRAGWRVIEWAANEPPEWLK
jgi:D-amino peptidase